MLKKKKAKKVKRPDKLGSVREELLALNDRLDLILRLLERQKYPTVSYPPIVPGPKDSWSPVPYPPHIITFDNARFVTNCSPNFIRRDEGGDPVPA